MQQVIADPVRAIVKQLDYITASGNHADTVFSDWLEVIEATMAMQDAHSAAMRTTGKMAEDTPEIAALWARLRQRYRQSYYFECFARAYGALLLGCDAYRDLLGEVYMQWGHPNKGTGQFFTPFAVCEMMAEMTMGDCEGLLWERIEASIDQVPFAQEVYGACAGLTDADQHAWLCALVVPLIIDLLEPIKVSDPAVGSGALLLAAASRLPQWAVRLGLVRFYGQDIDPVCVKMARAQIRLFGLNGYGAGEVLAAASERLAALPEPERTRFTQWQERTEAYIAAQLQEAPLLANAA